MRDFLEPMYKPRTDGFSLYAVVAALLAAGGSFAILAAVDHFTDWLGPDVEGPSVDVGLVHFFGIVIFSPLAETALLLLTLRLVQNTGAKDGVAAALAALVWGGLHGLLYPAWFFGTVWSFFVFSCGALAWHGKSRKHAYWAAALPHAIVNAGVFVALAYSAGA